MGGHIELESEYLQGTTVAFAIENKLEKPLFDKMPQTVSAPVLILSHGSPYSPGLCNVYESPPLSYNTPYSFKEAKLLSKCACNEPKVLIVDDEFICAGVLQTYLKNLRIDSDIVSLVFIVLLLLNV